MAADSVTVDFEMAERAIDWLDFVAGGADEEAIRDRFFRDVAPTQGCQVTVRHWARFREWDEGRLYTFILQGLGRVAHPDPLTNPDGSLTLLGRRRALWTTGLEDPAALRADLQGLRNASLQVSAVELALQYLPEGADVTNAFYVVLFGGSSAFSVGEENGYDLLQTPKTAGGEIDVDEVLRTFAHEMHHSGFSNETARHMKGFDSEGLDLLATLASEGMATCFISRTRERLDDYRRSGNPMWRNLVADWDRHLTRLPELYAEAERDIRRTLSGEVTNGEVFDHWMDGTQGPAYILGADMCATIEAELSADAARPIAQDYRRLLAVYNRAAMHANERGEARFLYDADLVVAVGDGDDEVADA